MYHIKDDKRAQTTAEMMYGALIALLKEKAYPEISITELVNRATVGRSTFYRNFDELSDILYWKCDMQFAQVLERFLAQSPEQNQPMALISYVFDYWQKHSEVMEALLTIGRIDIIYDCFYKNSHIIMDVFCQKLSITQTQYEYIISSRAGVLIGVMRTWLDRGKQESAEEITHMLEASFVLSENGIIL